VRNRMRADDWPRGGLAFAPHLCLYGVREEDIALCMSLLSTYGVCDQPTTERRGPMFLSVLPNAPMLNYPPKMSRTVEQCVRLTFSNRHFDPQSGRSLQ